MLEADGGMDYGRKCRVSECTPFISKSPVGMLEIRLAVCYILTMRNIHEKFVEYGRNARKWINECKMLLPEIDRQKIWYEKGFGSIYEYASKLAGLSHGQVRDALRIMKRIEDKPALIEVAKEKGINAVRPVATIATKKNQEFWAEKAQIMSKNTLMAFVRSSGTGPTLNQKTIQMTLSQKTVAKLEKIKGDRDWEEIMIELLEAKALQKPAPVESKNHYIPAAIRNFVIQKYHGLCAFPGCCKEYEELHHTYRFSLFGVHDPDQIVPLCKSHHDLAHHGLIENETKSPEKWEIREFAEVIHPNFEIDEYMQKCRSG